MDSVVYTSILAQHQKTFAHHQQKLNQLSWARLLVGFSLGLSIYFAFPHFYFFWIVSIVLLTFLFGYLVRLYAKQSAEKKRVAALIQINQDEIDFIENKAWNFADGSEFINPAHAYSFDLDFFGLRSFFQFLNRTETHIGKKTLALSLLSIRPADIILDHQKALEELKDKVSWRQDIRALAKLSGDSEAIYEGLKKWSKTDKTPQNKVDHFLSFFLPALLFSVILYNQFADAGLGKLIMGLFLLNLSVVGRQLKTIKKELFDANNIDKTLKKYGAMLEKIESMEAHSPLLLQLQVRLQVNQHTASKEMNRLAQLFDQLENILNPLGGILFNGFFLFHLHTLRNLRIWKQQNAEQMMDWLDVLGEIEALLSLANFAFNQPECTFPIINQNNQIAFEGLGHPLLTKKERVTSTISFEKQHFILLTGSNMSGKSTFLRSLGINMVLAGMGAPVCASNATVHPMPVHVSMRVSDSLNDHTSFFFAEVKRLKEVMNAAEKETCFVLLDEILRGTNSDDKRTGTVEVIKKIIAKKAIGAVATHDLKVCDTTADFPDQLMNKCFEVEIVNNELYFDYQLRDGVCKNKSATFLMQKMGVI